MRTPASRWSSSPGSPLDEEVFGRFAASLSYITGSAEDPAAMARLKVALDDADQEHGCNGMRMFYLAVPSAAFPIISRAIGDIGANTAGLGPRGREAVRLLARVLTRPHRGDP